MPLRISRTSERRVQSLWFQMTAVRLHVLIAPTLIVLAVLLFDAIANWMMIAIAGLIILSYVALALILIRVMPELLELLRSKVFLSILLGEVCFFAITAPVNAAIFDTAESYTTEIFGKYIDESMIKLIFGFLRISAFIMGAAFVMLALEKARHGENWQPFAWNAFAVLMVVVLIEGMSGIFLSSTVAKPTPSSTP